MKSKNSFYSLMILLSFVFIVASCKKDNSTSGSGSSNTNTVEQNKTDINNAGVSFVQQLDQMSNNQGFSALYQLNQFFNDDNLFTSKKKSLKSSPNKILGSIISQINFIAKFRQKQTTMTNMFKSMNYAQKKITSDSSAQQYFDSIEGVYNWDATNLKWIKVQTSNDLVFNFPATQSSTTNNATLSITQFTTQYVQSAEVPNDIAWNLQINGTTYMNFTYTASFANGIPTVVNSTLSISP